MPMSLSSSSSSSSIFSFAITYLWLQTWIQLGPHVKKKNLSSLARCDPKVSSKVFDQRQ